MYHHLIYYHYCQYLHKYSNVFIINNLVELLPVKQVSK